MILKRTLNNNVVLAKNENHQEVVVFGNGIAFNRKPGDIIDESKISKVFTLQSQNLSLKMANLLKEVPVVYAEIAEEIIKYARTKIKTPIGDYLFLALTDHIYYAVSRYKDGLDIHNVLLWEARKLYKTEFEIGLKALEIIKAKVGVEFSEDEAGFIAFHFANAQMEGEEVNRTVKITQFVQDILGIIKYHFGIEFDEDSWNYGRLVTHLKFLHNEYFPVIPDIRMMTIYTSKFSISIKKLLNVSRRLKNMWQMVMGFLFQKQKWSI